MYWPRLLVANLILNFHYDVGCQGLEIYLCIKFHLRGSVTCTYMYAIINALADIVFRKDIFVYIILTMTMFVRSQSFIALPSFMFVGAAVSECNQNKRKEKKNNF